jgi:predicted transcriptional regulator
MSEFREYLKNQLKDPAIKAEYDALQPEFAIIRAMIDARNKSGISKKELAERTGISKSFITKLENGNANPSLTTMKRLAAGLGLRLKIKFV